MPAEGERRGGGAHDHPNLHVQLPAVGQKEVISSPASQHQKESFKDYDSLPQAVFPTGFKTGVGKRGRAPGSESTDNDDDARSPSHSSPQRRSYYPDEAFIISPIATRSDDYRRRNESATECATNASASFYSPSSRSNATRTLLLDNEVHGGGETRGGDDDGKEGASGGLHAVASKGRDGAEEDKKPQRKICGMRRRWFFVAVAVIAIILVGVLIGVVVWATSRNHDSSLGGEASETSHPPPPNNPGRGGLHQNARLTAISWAGDGGQMYRAVISQDRSGSLFASYLETNGTWTPIRVSSLLKPLESTDGGVKPADLDPAAGTPLAAAVSSTSGLNVFFKTKNNSVFSIRASVNNRASWDWSEQSREMRKRPDMTDNVAVKGSDLAAATRRVCSDPTGKNHCFNDVLAVYLASDNGPSGNSGVLRLFNETHWRTYSREPLAPITNTQWKTEPSYRGLSSYALSMTHFPQDSIPRSLVGSMRVYFADGDGLPQEIVSNATTGPSTWVLDSVVERDRLDYGALSPGRLAVSTFDGGTQMLMVTATPDGKFLAVRHWARGSYFWAGQRRLRIAGRPANLSAEFNITALAITDKHLYINNNSTNIEEYRWGGDDPYSVVYMGIVDIFPPEG
ncbi:hypothetical protein MAPG_04210 [Magnaporthiopsis poae ATCC 64411]|uniref:Fucose-specific lectin n=1 Tax=Magnaporthiopsis poae (strain ATCC 64411 / 73-15) TaxID=644358 RepID=A0A0C4DW39_MAGP6|nr:hypothetical protein MAPG_04210 [Magnaporthiopsis poae ATCC 64411]